MSVLNGVVITKIFEISLMSNLLWLENEIFIIILLLLFLGVSSEVLNLAERLAPSALIILQTLRSCLIHAHQLLLWACFYFLKKPVILPTPVDSPNSNLNVNVIMNGDTCE